MRKALIYFYEVKHGDISKANQGLGILPYIYEDAKRYYYAIWEANQRNKENIVRLETFYPQTKIVKIKMPKRKIKENHLFTFLDEE